MMRDDMKCILIDREKIAQRVKELGAQITKDYKGEAPLFVCILKGSVVFFADLIREVDLPLQIEFMKARKNSAKKIRPHYQKKKALNFM